MKLTWVKMEREEAIADAFKGGRKKIMVARSKASNCR
jgi:hypothetical protein